MIANGLGFCYYKKRLRDTHNLWFWICCPINTKEEGNRNVFYNWTTKLAFLCFLIYVKQGSWVHIENSDKKVEFVLTCYNVNIEKIAQPTQTMM